MYSYITGKNKEGEFFSTISGAAAYGVGELGGLIFTDICSSTATLTANQVRLIALAAEGGMHAVSQAYVAGLSGGDAGQGFRSALVSSVVASVTGGVNSFAGLSGTAGDISTMLFGSVSGGLSAKLTGGNFWQGAATGLTVSALNHVAHQMSSPTENSNTTEKGDIGSNTLDNTEGSPGPSGEIIFKDLTKKQLGDFRVIPEDGNPYNPTQNGIYEGDGFYYKNFSDKKYWYKVSAGGSVTITFSNNRYNFTGVTSGFWQFMAQSTGRYYKVGWEPKSRSHWTKNPFDLNNR